MRARLLAILLSATVPAHAAGQQSFRVDPLAGCYTVSRGAWTSDGVPTASRSPSETPPPRVRLTMETEDAAPVARALKVSPSGLAAGGIGYWIRTSRDSIVVTWTNGSRGVELRLQDDIDVLRGVARTVSDEPDPPSRALVAARRVPCLPTDGRE